MKEDRKDFVSGFVLGGLLGVLLGVVLAPKPGSETREDLLKKFGELKGMVSSDLVEKVRNLTVKKKNTVKKSSKKSVGKAEGKSTNRTKK
ncbi:YtxH domain-containing protein [Patescibacteria group bacterium]|nr:YtxH domain-containing protein [Patescibacteria group bacterium]